MFMNFYRKSAGVSTRCSVILLQDVSKWDFGAWMEGKRWRNEYGGEIGV